MFFVPGFRVEGARVRCGVPAVLLLGREARPGQQVTLPGLERGVEPWGAVEGCRPRRESVDSPASPVQHPLPPIRREMLVRRWEVLARHRGWLPVRVLGWLPTG